MSKNFIYTCLVLLLGTSNTLAQTIAAGHKHSLSICTDGTVRAWGRNDFGQLGDGTLTQRLTPVQVSSLTGIIAIAGGERHTIALKNDGTVWAWGHNGYGQLGDGTNTDRLTPVQVSGLTGVTAIKGGNAHSLFLKNDDTVWACGWNLYGQLGDGTTTNRLTPVPVSGLTGIMDIAAGGAGHSLFLKNDGTVLAVGANYYGHLGDGTQTNRLTPVPVSGLTGITTMAEGEWHSLFLKNDGTVWACGWNVSAQLGDGTTTQRTTPVPVNGLTGITAIAGGDLNSLFLKNDGTVWAVGRNIEGQLGDGTITNRLTPVQTVGLCQVQQPTVYILQGIYGEVYNDVNQNCIKETENLLPGRKLIINPGNIIVETNIRGYWYIDSLPSGNYTITADTSGKWRRACPLVQSFTISNSDSIYIAPNFGFISTEPCAEPQVSVNMPRMRPGFSNQKIYVQACNEYKATGELTNAYVIVELDPSLTPQSGSQSYTSLGSNRYRFNLGTMNPGVCKSLWLSCSLSTNAVLNSTLCIKANLYPADSCVFDTIPNVVTGVTPCTLPWDKSSLKVTGKCTGDSVRFVVYNHGSGDMDCYAPVRVYVNGILMSLDSIMLTSGDSAVFAFLGNGKAWRLEADQHPLHPGNSHPNATIENCNPGTWTPGLVNVLPQDDADPVVDIYCGMVTGSYDPNDKTGYPLGVDTAHNVLPNQQMEYMIRFQNTGTDTAFTVVIRDTLDMDLDIFSVVSGVSSHKYKFKMYGPRILEWTFNNILLPDSNINEAKSHGFVTFKVNQNRNLANGTEIRNTAGIYFDYNAPIITNTTIHTVNDQIITKQWSHQQTLFLVDCESVTVNGYNYTQTGSYYQVHEDTLYTINATINNKKRVQNITVCAGDSITVGTNTYTSAGTYTDVLTSSLGCDSTVTTNLTVLNAIQYTQNLTICAGESITVGANTYNSSGTFTDVLTASNGCDSTVTTNLTVLNAIQHTQNLTICSGESITVGANTYNSSGTFTDVLIASNGCDSTVTTNLTVNAVDATVVHNTITLTAQATSATYQWLDCTAGYVPISGQTGNSFTATANGMYAVIVTQNGCSDTSACYTVTQVGLPTLRQAQGDRLVVYPNPATDELTIIRSSSFVGSNSNIEIYNGIGVKKLEARSKKLDSSIPQSDSSVVIDISDLPKGMYVVKCGAEAVKLVVE